MWNTVYASGILNEHRELYKKHDIDLDMIESHWNCTDRIWIDKYDMYRYMVYGYNDGNGNDSDVNISMCAKWW